MSTKQERIKVFQDTMDWIENDIELSASVIYSKEHTKIYWENDYPEFDAEKACDTEVTVTRDRSYQAAMRLAAEKCPADQKKARVSAFAHKLVENDGPAVSMMAKLFGKETMQRIVLKHMYGVE